MAESHDIKLDMSRAGPDSHITKMRSGSKRDIAYYWDSRYGAFLKDGFTDEEAKWGADNGLSLKNKTVKEVRIHRRGLIRFYMRHGNTRFRAIELAASELDNVLQTYGIKEKNIFYEFYIRYQ